MVQKIFTYFNNAEKEGEYVWYAISEDVWAVPSILKTHRIGRIFGVCLVGLYIAYMAFTILRG